MLYQHKIRKKERTYSNLIRLSFSRTKLIIHVSNIITIDHTIILI